MGRRLGRALKLPSALGEIVELGGVVDEDAVGNDLLRGNRLELPWFAGKVVKLGRRHGIPTPVNGFIYAALKPYIDGAPA
jgi:hypothetical protein